MDSIFVFSQNVILDSFEELTSYAGERNVFITTHYLFENERRYLSTLFNNCVYLCFADFLSDEDMSNCDISAFSTNITKSQYVMKLNKLKNVMVVKRVEETFPNSSRYVLSEDLGIVIHEWEKAGFCHLKVAQYFIEKKSLKDRLADYLRNLKWLRRIYGMISPQKTLQHKPEEVLVGYYNNHKYVFLGNLNRIGYRLNIDFLESKDECDRLNKGIFEKGNTCTYVTTWHEQSCCNVPDSSEYSVRWAQDGYLPPNYSHFDYSFKPNNVIYYCWDKIGTYLFENKKLPYEIIPFRKKLYLPEPKFPPTIKNILIVASGSGDWTALKNRSDDDLMVAAFAKMAERFPNITFTYRCHPTWTHPKHVGINSINRVAEYFMSTGLKNIKVSSNIPNARVSGSYILSFSRTSLEGDLQNADFVFGEHSISMIDAAFKAIPFASVNLTNRRNFFEGITDLGFPSCTTYEQIEDVINSIATDEFKKAYLSAITRYNEMTDVE